MSRIYFHSPSGEAEVRGFERARMGTWCEHLATGMLDMGGYLDVEKAKRVHSLTTPGKWKLDDPIGYRDIARFASEFSMAFGSIMFDDLLSYRDHRIDKLGVILNTALMLGNDAVKLAARLHGQCEIHAWVSGENRDWLAGIVEQGLAVGLYTTSREDGMSAGWEDLVTFLRERADEPVVTSYSVCDSFPSISCLSPAVLPHVEDEDGGYDDWWYEKLSEEGRWSMAFGGLTEDRVNGDVELSPRRWAYPEYHFNEGITVFDLTAPDQEARLDKAFGLEPVPA